MRITRFLLVTIVATSALVPVAAWSSELDPVDYIVSSRIVSDEVVSDTAGQAKAGDNKAANDNSNLGNNDGCPDGSACAAGSSSSEVAVNAGTGRVGHGVGRGAVGRRLASAVSYVGDIASGGRAAGDVGCVPRTYGYPDLFYNYYTQGNCNATNAQMYISPVPVPPNVGHTFYTYQPFMPHEMLYWHTDRYHNYYDGGRGMNHTKVHYFAPPIRQATSNFYWNHLRIPR